MEFYRQNEDQDDSKDPYYIEQTQLAIDAAMKEAEGRDLEATRFLLRRSYPFGALRRGRSYKIWNRMISAKEAELGIASRKHNNRAYKPAPPPPPEPPTSHNRYAR